MKSENEKIMVLRVDELDPHPDAEAYGKYRGVKESVEDLIALTEDIRDVGIIKTLDVVRSADGKKWLVIDGCRRLYIARKLKIDEIRCVERVGVRDVREYAVRSNAMARRLTASERLLLWADLHRVEIAEAWKAGHEQSSGRGKLGGQFQGGTGVYTIDGIVRRMGCSRRDATAVQHIEACLHYGMKPQRNVDTKKTDLVPGDGGRDAACMRDAVNAVLNGCSIAKWSAAFGGKVKTAGRGKAETDYAALAESSSISLANALSHWSDADWAGRVSRMKVEKQLVTVLDALAACHGAEFFVRAIKGRWTPDMVAQLVKGVKA